MFQKKTEYRCMKFSILMYKNVTACIVLGAISTRISFFFQDSSHVVQRVVLSNSFEPSDDPEFLHNDPEFLHANIDTPEEIISHIFHKASIAILAILVVYVSVST